MKKLHTDRGIQTLLIQGFQQWRKGKEELEIPDDEYRRIITSQNRIGWVELFRGQFSIAWSNAQSEYYRKSQSKHTGTFWTTAIINHIWGQWEHLWELRNEAQHGRDRSHRHAIRKKVALEKLRYIYERKDQYLPLDRDILLDSVEEHATKPLYVIENWIALNWEVLMASRISAENNAIQNVQPLTTYFTTTKTPDTNKKKHSEKKQYTPPTRKKKTRKMIIAQIKKTFHPITKFFTKAK